MDEVVGQAYHQIHKFMFDNVYRNPQAKEEETKVPNLIQTLYEYVLPVSYTHLACMPNPKAGKWKCSTPMKQSLAAIKKSAL